MTLPTTTASTTRAWALRLPLNAGSALASLRLAPGVEIAADATALWLRGQHCDDELATTLRGLPADARYEWLTESGRLRPVGALLAAEKLPALDWQPLRAWLGLAPPAARFPAEQPRPAALQLVRGQTARRANAMLVALESWLAWMRTAPELRLARLRFAASADGRALVLGTPGPSLPGRACVEEAGVVVPAGFTWWPPVSARVVRRALSAPDDAVIWWDEAGARVLGTELFVAASRASAHATAAEWQRP